MDKTKLNFDEIQSTPNQNSSLTNTTTTTIDASVSINIDEQEESQHHSFSLDSLTSPPHFISTKSPIDTDKAILISKNALKAKELVNLQKEAKKVEKKRQREERKNRCAPFREEPDDITREELTEKQRAFRDLYERAQIETSFADALMRMRLWHYLKNDPEPYQQSVMEMYKQFRGFEECWKQFDFDPIVNYWKHEYFEERHDQLYNNYAPSCCVRFRQKLSESNQWPFIPNRYSLLFIDTDGFDFDKTYPKYKLW